MPRPKLRATDARDAADAHRPGRRATNKADIDIDIDIDIIPALSLHVRRLSPSGAPRRQWDCRTRSPAPFFLRIPAERMPR
ncbi:hypothetical protein, partial [Xanthomonas oryzae]|uniref:hypothetical protein n=1 Tax=Xanthomonas oryzae TaxID=347 RepID=UPI00051969C2